MLNEYNCLNCGRELKRKQGRGRIPLFCSIACKKSYYYNQIQLKKIRMAIGILVLETKDNPHDEINDFDIDFSKRLYALGARAILDSMKNIGYNWKYDGWHKVTQE